MRAACAVALLVPALTTARGESAQEPPTRIVAGIAIPDTPLSRRAESYVRSQEPDFLFNHSVRTFLFGALSLKTKGLSYDPETAYVAALFHD